MKSRRVSQRDRGECALVARRSGRESAGGVGERANEALDGGDGPRFVCRDRQPHLGDTAGCPRCESQTHGPGRIGPQSIHTTVGNPEVGGGNCRPGDTDGGSDVEALARCRGVCCGDQPGAHLGRSGDPS